MLTYSTPSASKTQFYNQTLKGELGFQAHDFVQYLKNKPKTNTGSFEFLGEKPGTVLPVRLMRRYGELQALDTEGTCLNSLQFASGRAVHALPPAGLLPDINPTVAPTWFHHLCPPSLPAPLDHTYLTYFCSLDYSFNP